MKSNNKTFFVTILGNTLEYYDLGLCGFLSPIFASLYFPAHNNFILLLSSLTIFASGFIMRPFGAFIFGYIGDFLGRKISLSHTMLLMALITFVISILPTYSDIGIFAPLILILCRLIQGICVGGECNNAAIFILESVPVHKKCLYSSFITASAMFGFFLASSISIIIIYLPFSISWTWRIPFFLGSLIGVLGFYIRSHKILESPCFKKPEPSFFWLDLKKNKRAMLLTICVGWFSGVLGLSLVGYIPSYLKLVTHLPPNQAILIANIGLLLYLIFLPIVGMMADKLSAQKLMNCSIVLTIFFSYLMFLFLSKGLFFSIIGVSMLAFFAALYIGPMHAYMLELFPPHFRCRGTSLSFSLGVGILGSTSPLIGTLLIRRLGLMEAPAFYFIISALIVLFLTRKFGVITKKKEIS